MTIGIKHLDGTFIATPDKSMTKTSAPKVLSVSFGDGYEQRIADGINSLKETYSLSFKTRPKADIDDIVVFLDTKKNVSKFLFTMPDTNNTTRTGEKDLKVVSTGYSLTYDYDNFYSLTLSLKRVFEA
jgi:phage-related protein|tara:strand:- start:225 stop:608 length:384 start_codon:yes stop_codon:yes gene_type:complete